MSMTFSRIVPCIDCINIIRTCVPFIVSVCSKLDLLNKSLGRILSYLIFMLKAWFMHNQSYRSISPTTHYFWRFGYVMYTLQRKFHHGLLSS